MEQHETDEKFMRLALNEAQKALKQQEVPIGAVVVAGGAVIGRGHNLVETLADPTAHAEMQALTAAAATLGGAPGGVRGVDEWFFRGFARIDLVKKEFFLYFCIQRVSDRGA